MNSNCVDGLGRLTSVVEPDGAVTQHTYNALDNLIQVNRAGQIRAFEYDSLGRLTKACNPESATATCGTTPLPLGEQYTYDANGNPLTKTDARGIITTYTGYDGLNRPHGKTYSDGTPTVTYTYDQDTKGALSKVSISINGLAYSTAYLHDGFGRIKSSTQTTADHPYVFNYQYSLSDRLTQIQYPSGRTVNYVPDTAGRIVAVQNGATLANYATLSYTAPGGISALAMANGIIEQLTWNDRMQVTQLAAGSALTLGFRFCPGSSLPSCPTVNNTGNNGNLRSQTIVAPGLSLTQTYTYDNVDRLTGASEMGTGTWNETYHYDGPLGSTYGNRWVDTNTRSGLPPLTLETPQTASWYASNNQIAPGFSWTMDAAGNVNNVGNMSRSFGYDAANRQTTATISGVVSNYTYDGDGRRVQKTANGVVTTYVYDAGGELAAEYSTQPGPSACGTSTCYVTVDHLGSTRMLTDSAGNVVRRYDYLPFGVEILAGTGGRTTGMGYHLNYAQQ